MCLWAFISILLGRFMTSWREATTKNCWCISKSQHKLTSFVGPCYVYTGALGLMEAMALPCLLCVSHSQVSSAIRRASKHRGGFRCVARVSASMDLQTLHHARAKPWPLSCCIMHYGQFVLLPQYLGQSCLFWHQVTFRRISYCSSTDFRLLYGALHPIYVN